MAIRLEELLRLPTLRYMKLLAGKGGLDRIVTWPYVCQMSSFSEWVQGGELIFFTGVGMKLDDESLITFVMQGDEKNCAGLVFFKSEYIKGISERVLSLANQLSLPVFEIPWEVKLVDITKEVSGFILSRQNEFGSLQTIAENLLSENPEAAELAAGDAQRFGFDPKLPHFVALLSAENAGSTSGPESFFYNLVEDYFAHSPASVLCVPHGGAALLLLPSKSGMEEKGQLESICDLLLDRFSGVRVRCGVGRAYKSAPELKESLRDAQKAFKFTSASPSAKAVQTYRSLGVYRLFFEVSRQKALEDFYSDVMGPLIEYDRQNNTEFVKTLKVYFENKLNHNKTARDLYIHRNSLTYRVTRIEEILGRSLRDPQALIELQLCTLIGKYLSLD